jgi:hypothetical protein
VKDWKIYYFSCKNFIWSNKIQLWVLFVSHVEIFSDYFQHNVLEYWFKYPIIVISSFLFNKNWPIILISASGANLARIRLFYLTYLDSWCQPYIENTCLLRAFIFFVLKKKSHLKTKFHTNFKKSMELWSSRPKMEARSTCNNSSKRVK